MTSQPDLTRQFLLINLAKVKSEYTLSVKMKTAVLSFSFSFLLLCPLARTYAQDSIHVHSYCNFDGRELRQNKYAVFGASDEAEEIVADILDINHIQANFILKESSCQNALATRIADKRYILYNPEFIRQFRIGAQSKWAVWSVFAHEIAHHLHNDDFGEADLSVRRAYELEADEFASSTLCRSGASLEQVLAGLEMYAPRNISSTHPSVFERRQAMMHVFKEEYEFRGSTSYIEQQRELRHLEREQQKKKAASEDAFIGPVRPATDGPVDSNAFNLLIQGNLSKMPADKIRAYTRAILIRPDYADAYNNRGNAQADLGKFENAVADYNRAILLNPGDAIPYNNRGLARIKMGNPKEAIMDFTKAIMLDSTSMTSYNNRGEAYLQLSRYEEAITDFDKAIELDKDFALPYANKGCALVHLNKSKEGIEWLNLALQKNPRLVNAVQCREKALRH